MFLSSLLKGGVKVLITGPWQEASSNYSCLFDQISVPASLIQPGVLRCYCPGKTKLHSHAILLFTKFFTRFDFIKTDRILM